MTKTGILSFLGVVVIFGMAFGAFQFGKVITEREVPTVDERLEYLKNLQTLNTKSDRDAFVIAIGKSRRPRLTLSSAAAGNCEPFLDSADHYFAQAEEILARYPNTDALLKSGTQDDRGLVNYYTLISVTMADSYDDCLGNP
ncbi:MAG: hypothetical protein RL681_164 [Candidatus Parcubacteria bacterium]|jgi:hypothetical protein